MTDSDSPDKPLRIRDLMFEWKLPWLGSLIVAVCTFSLYLFNTGHQRLGEGAASGLSSFPLLLLSLILLSLATAISLLSLLLGRKTDRRARAKEWFLPAFRLCAEYAVALIAVGIVTLKPVLQSVGPVVASVQVVVPVVFLALALWLSRTIVTLHGSWKSNAGWRGVAVTVVALVLLAAVITFTSIITLPAALDGLVKNYVELFASSSLAIAKEDILPWAVCHLGGALLLWLFQFFWSRCHGSCDVSSP